MLLYLHATVIRVALFLVPLRCRIIFLFSLLITEFFSFHNSNRVSPSMTFVNQSHAIVVQQDQLSLCHRANQLTTQSTYQLENSPFHPEQT